jgi:hypothetical protein
MGSPPDHSARSFQFERDTFSFANGLVWEYRFDPATGKTTTFRNEPAPAYAHRCFVMVRSARQFFYHARFEPARAVADERTYRGLIREIVSRSPRQPSADPDKLLIPGYDSLRSFSQAQAPLLQAECGGAWQSYFLRSHWRMILPMPRGHQERLARHLVEVFPKRIAPIVHLVRFPQLTINHGIVLFDFTETGAEIRFAAYDPNVPEHPSELIYDCAKRTFLFPRNHYWNGGRVDVVEVYRGWLY